VVSCSDHRAQRSLRAFLARQKLEDAAELISWPGGGWALANKDGDRLLRAVERLGPFRRILLVAHADCHDAGPVVGGSESPLAALRAAITQRSGVVGQVLRRLDVEPELWFLDERGARRVRGSRRRRASDRKRELAR
jgi:hypothetical protein